MKPTESITSALLVAVLACAVMTAPATAAQFDTTVQEDGVEIVVEEQTSDTVTVLLTSSANDVAGLETNMTFDADVIQLESVEGVDLAEPITRHSNENGWVFITQAQPSGVDDPTMTRLTFEIVSEGTTELSFTSEATDVFNSEGQEIPIVTTNTNVDVSADDGSDDADGDGDASDTGDGESDDEESGADDGDDTGNADDSGETSDDADSSETSDNSDTGETSDGADSGETSDSSDSGGTSAESSDGTADETDGNDESADEEPAGGSSSMISGIGLLAVVAGFLFAIAVLAREQL
jgi:hypothetical protein